MDGRPKLRYADIGRKPSTEFSFKTHVYQKRVLQDPRQAYAIGLIGDARHQPVRSLLEEFVKLKRRLDEIYDV